MSFEVHPGKDPPVPSAVGYYAKLPAKLIGEAFAVADAHDVQTGIVAQPFLTLFDPASDTTLSADHCLPLSLSPFPKIMAQGPLVSRGEKDERLMFIAMNRFRIVQGREAEFERVWAERDTHLDGVPGFMGFRLLKGPQSDDYTLYASHSTWRNRESFEAWTQSEAFRKAHAGAGGQRELYLGHPQFEGFDSVLDR